MKRVAIVTITNSGSNFGNRLQNYALQTVLERLDCVAETIFTAKSVRRSFILSRLRWTARSIIKRTRRRYYFDSFNKKYIRAARRIRYQKLNDGAFARDGYDAAISGSDQVWNPEFDFNTDFEFLTFMPPDKRYAYAASFGVDEIPAGRREEITRLLNEMREISVREDAGSAIVRELTGRDVSVHADPTLLLEAADYEIISRKPPQPLPERYVLTYFLGEVPQSYRAFIAEISQNLGMPVIEVDERRSCEFFNIGPRHFLYLIRGADYVCTDSFHGTVFSILFHRPFTSFRRQGECDRMGSRMDTLLRITRLENRIYDDSASTRWSRAIDYAEVDGAVGRERERALDYLRAIRAKW